MKIATFFTRLSAKMVTSLKASSQNAMAIYHGYESDKSLKESHQKLWREQERNVTLQGFQTSWKFCKGGLANQNYETISLYGWRVIVEKIGGARE